MWEAAHFFGHWSDCFCTHKQILQNPIFQFGIKGYQRIKCFFFSFEGFAAARRNSYEKIWSFYSCNAEWYKVYDSPWWLTPQDLYLYSYIHRIVTNLWMLYVSYYIRTVYIINVSNDASPIGIGSTMKRIVEWGKSSMCQTAISNQPSLSYFEDKLIY